MSVPSQPLPADGLFDPTALVAALAAAPSVHNTQPWRVRRIDGGLQLRADTRRRLLATDRTGRELRISCGAGLMNMRLAMSVAGRRPVIRLLPDAADPDVLATIYRGGPAEPTPEEVRLHAVVPARHSYRRPFREVPVAPLHRHLLRRAAEREGAWLHGVDSRHEQDRLRTLFVAAHRAQRADSGFVLEWETWTGRPDGERTGVTLRSAGPPPAENDMWMVRDFTHSCSPDEEARQEQEEFDPAPLVLVICTHNDMPAAHLGAGQALQRVLLTATALGLSSSVLSAAVEVDDTRRQLRRFVGPEVYPQILVRVGHGDVVPVGAPRLGPSQLWG